LIHVCTVPVRIASLPGVSMLLWAEAMTLSVRAREVQTPCEKMGVSHLLHVAFFTGLCGS